MLEELRDLLAGSDDERPRPERIEEAIEEAESDLQTARTRLSELEEEHGDIVLSGDADRIAEHEAEIEAAKRTVERLDAARERLEERLKEAEEAAEAREAARRAEEALELKAKGEELLEEWRQLVRRAREILARLEEIESAVGRRREAFRRSPEHEYADGTPPLRAASLGTVNPDPTEKTVLPPAGPETPGWNSRNWAEPREKKRLSDDSEEESAEMRRRAEARNQPGDHRVRS